jgi:hypothetical protein
MAGRLVRGEQRFGHVHVRVLAAVRRYVPVRRRVVGVEAGGGVPEAVLGELEGRCDQRARFVDAAIACAAASSTNASP